MKRSLVASQLIIALLIIANQALAERKVIDGAASCYIHQVLDTDSTETSFSGHNACAPTSACMLLQFHNLQTAPSGYSIGWYVFNPYVGFTDKSGNSYSSIKAKDWNPHSTANPHPHEVYGAHGFTIAQDISTGDWRAEYWLVRNYLQNHGLIASMGTIETNRFQVIKSNIKAGLPLIGHSIISGNGHYLVIIGYDTGTNDNEQKVIVNDPFGDANGNWISGNNRGVGVTYPLSGNCGPNTVQIDWVAEVKPVSLYYQTPHWRNDEGFCISDRFQEKYNAAPVINGMNKLGIPFKDVGGNIYVHDWNGVIIQNFK